MIITTIFNFKYASTQCDNSSVKILLPSIKISILFSVSVSNLL